VSGEELVPACVGRGLGLVLGGTGSEGLALGGRVELRGEGGSLGVKPCSYMGELLLSEQRAGGYRVT
jgi:hypothetical protein